MNPPQSLPPSHVEPSIEDAEKSKGFYTVRGVVYLEGQAHESKLTKAKPCEVWIDDEESWVPVTITRIFTTTVHDTNEKFKHYHVQRQDDPAAPPIEDVRSDALRIPLNLPVGMVVPTEPDQTADFLHRVQQVVAGDSSCRVAEPVAAKSAPDYGGGATVSVRVVDEAAEEAAIEADAKAFQAQTTAIQVERDNELLMEESLHADNAMGAFNPWGGRYKGIALDETSKNDPDEEDNGGGRGKANHVVAFHVKKGKRANGKRRVADDA
ncbi:hypothetical protein DYB37_001815 [Aphanomyces astaci]|uniref:Uncharacterized protein n=1 Tax=Aphanomyces astaci TaxID=112090 RepID=A0A418F367_APHAT|nr:hypothetical protein DYB37_001815 [Aphanomyces astaci]